jgi:hypothetical protein
VRTKVKPNQNREKPTTLQTAHRAAACLRVPDQPPRRGRAGHVNGESLVEGYGHVTTTLDLTGAVFDPATGCLTDVTAVRNVALVDDSTSTLTLALSDGVICDNKGSATFTISAATGVFAGLVVSPGSVRVTLIPGVPGDSAQYRADIVS